MGKRIYNLQYFKNLAITKGGECLSDEYISCVKKLTFKCDKGHVWETKPYYLVNNNSWCPKCSKTANNNIKNEYCKKNNITLIRIPYTVQNIDVYLLNELDGVMELVS
jgi:hypothetical protein